MGLPEEMLDPRPKRKEGEHELTLQQAMTHTKIERENRPRLMPEKRNCRGMTRAPQEGSELAHKATWTLKGLRLCSSMAPPITDLPVNGRRQQEVPVDGSRSTPQESPCTPNNTWTDDTAVGSLRHMIRNVVIATPDPQQASATEPLVPACSLTRMIRGVVCANQRDN